MSNTGMYAVVKDNFSSANDNLPLNLDGTTTFSFTVTGNPASYAYNRFSIVFYKLSSVLPVSFTALKAVRHNNHIAVEWQTTHADAIHQYEVETSVNGVDFVKAYTITNVSNQANNSTYNWADSNVTAGLHYYRIKAIDAAENFVYSNIAKVQVSTTGSNITVFPNPVKDGIMHVQFTAAQKGNYQLRLVNSFGQTILSQKTAITGSGMQTILLPKETGKGFYNLEILQPDNSKQTIAVLVE